MPAWIGEERGLGVSTRRRSFAEDFLGFQVECFLLWVVFCGSCEEEAFVRGRSLGFRGVWGALGKSGGECEKGGLVL